MTTRSVGRIALCEVWERRALTKVTYLPMAGAARSAWVWRAYQSTSGKGRPNNGRLERNWSATVMLFRVAFRSNSRRTHTYVRRSALPAPRFLSSHDPDRLSSLRTVTVCQIPSWIETSR